MAVLTAFRDRLLELVPIYSAAGRSILTLPVPDVPDRTAAFALAERVSSWLLDALAVMAEHEPDLSAIAGNARSLPAPTDPTVALRWHELATDLAVIAQGFPSARRLQRLAESARAVFQAVVPEQSSDAGTAAADALYARVDSPDAVALEARAVLSLRAIRADF